eukprot:m51a1_g13078 hypothetical protein (165) ;mRNA; r:285-779
MESRLLAEQGDLDGLCGVYAIVNAMKAMYGSTFSRDKIFRAIICTKTFTKQMVSEGITAKELCNILRELDHSCRTAADSGVAPRKDSLRKCIEEELGKKNGVIVGYNSTVSAHWVAVVGLVGDRTYEVVNGSGELLKGLAVSCRDPGKYEKTTQLDAVIFIDHQ